MITPDSTAEITTDPRVRAEAAEHPYSLLFATVSGAHLYGFASADADEAIKDLLRRIRRAASVSA